MTSAVLEADDNDPGFYPKALRTRVIWDIVPDSLVAGWSVDLGAVPGSEEGQKMERDAAQARRNALVPLMLPLSMTSGIAGEIISKSMILGGSSTPDEEQVRNAVMSGAMAVVANLLDMGHLTYGPAVTGE